MGIKSLLFEITLIGVQIMKLQFLLINLVYGMFGLGLRKDPKSAPGYVAFFMSLTVVETDKRFCHDIQKLKISSQIVHLCLQCL